MVGVLLRRFNVFIRRPFRSELWCTEKVCLPKKGPPTMQRMVRFAKDVVNGWLNAEAFTLAAALAYYAIFAIAPLLLISIHIGSLFFDRTAAIDGLTRELSGVVGPTGSDAIRQMLEAAGTARPEGWAGLVAIGVLIFAAGGFVGSLQDALDKIKFQPWDWVWICLRLPAALKEFAATHEQPLNQHVLVGAKEHERGEPNEPVRGWSTCPGTQK
jgi:hypothetical protein